MRLLNTTPKPPKSATIELDEAQMKLMFALLGISDIQAVRKTHREVFKEDISIYYTAREIVTLQQDINDALK